MNVDSWLAALWKTFFAMFVALKGYLFPQEATQFLQLEQSPRGITYLRIYVPSDNTVAVRMVWDHRWQVWQGVNQDVPRIATRLIMEGGTQGQSPAAIVEAWADLDASASLSVKRGENLLSIDVPSESLDAAARLANTQLRQPALPEAWFERLREQVAQQNEEDSGRAVSQLDDALVLALAGDGPERRSHGHETPDSVRRLSLADVRAWQRAVFTSDPAAVTVSGNVGKEAAGRAVDQLVEGLPAKAEEPPGIRPSQSVANLAPRRILLHLPEAQETRLIIAGAIKGSATLDDWMILDSLAGRGGLLSDTARDRLRASYDFGWSDGFPLPRVRIFRLEGGIETAKLAEVTAALASNYASLYRTMAPLQMQGTRRRLLKAIWLAQYDSAGAADWVDANWWVGAGKDVLGNPLGYLSQVNTGTISRRFHEAFPRPEELIFIAVSPDANALPGACVITAPEQAMGCR